MKIVVLGGSGGVGRQVSRLLASRGAAVTRMDRSLPSDNLLLPFVSQDITDERGLVRALAPFDVVVNTVGPYDRWGGRVLDAAIAARTAYIDVCDDPLATSILLERHANAVEHGVAAVVGLGASPGLPNLLAVIASRHLDSTDTLVAYWGDPREGLSAAEARELASRTAASFRSGRSAWEHLVMQTTNAIPVWRDGRVVEEQPWQRAFRLTLSTGETGVFRIVGHPEAITLPLTVPTRDCFCVGSIGASLDRLIAEVIESLGEQAPDELLAEVAARLEADPECLVEPRVGPPLAGHLGAVAMGSRNGARITVTAMVGGPTDGSMSFETGRVAALGAELIESVPAGVHPPEAAFDAEHFLTEFAAREWNGAPAVLIDEAEGSALVELSSAGR